MTAPTVSGPRPVRAARGTELSTLGWQQEAALRMLQNNLDPEVAEHPDKLVVYGGTGKAARDWASFDALQRTLRTLKRRRDDARAERSARSASSTTHEWAPRVLIANSNLVGDWANWEEFRRLEHLGLTMYGQMTAGSWIYIGTQGILQGTYETFAAVGEQHFGGTLAGTITLTAGLGGMGGAQPLAVTMNDGVAICVDCDPRAHRAPHRAPLPRRRRPTASSTRSSWRSRRATRARGLSIGLLGNAAVLVPAAARDGRADRHRHRPDLGARPAVVPADRRRRSTTWRRTPRRTRQEFTAARARGDGHARRGDGRLHGQGRRGLRLRQLDPRRGAARPATRARSTSRASSRRTSARCSARARARSAGPRSRATRPTSRRPTARSSRCSPTTQNLQRWIPMAQERVHYQGLPARICWLGYGERHLAGLRFNEMVASGELQRADRHRPRPPRLRLGRLARTARPRPWPTARTRSPTGRCSTRWSTWPRAPRGCRSTTAAASASAARSTPARWRSPTAPTLAGEKLARVLTNDPGMGVIRHVDAGYDRAVEVADERGVRIPMRENG